MSDNILITFKAISNFTNELGEMFAKKQRSLKLYCHLINKTTIAHDKPIQKHINAFRAFCVANRESITQKNEELKITKILYSQRVFIDMEEIFKIADKETKDAIWSHLLCISALVDPAGKAKEILKKSIEDSKSGGGESEFLTNIIDKVEQHVDPNANPMEAVSSIMQSGIFTDLIGSMHNGMSDGSLDLSKLMGTVQNMVSSLGEQTEGDPNMPNPMSMISTMMGAMGGMGGMGGAPGAGGMPDLAAMMEEAKQQNSNPALESIKEEE